MAFFEAQGDRVARAGIRYVEDAGVGGEAGGARRRETPYPAGGPDLISAWVELRNLGPFVDVDVFVGHIEGDAVGGMGVELLDVVASPNEAISGW